MIVYHYTTKMNYDQIIASGEIKPSDQNTTMDAAYGAGWYFTDLDTDQCDMAVMLHCWGKTNVDERITHYLKFEIPETLLHNCRKHVYRVDNWDRTRIKYLGGGANRVCPKKPCHTCEHGKKMKSA